MAPSTDKAIESQVVQADDIWLHPLFDMTWRRKNFPDSWSARMTPSYQYNLTNYRMQSNAERYSWAAFHLFALISSIAGDTVILYASFQKDAFKLNKFIVTVIQYIAACDLVYALSTILPRAGSLLTNSRVLGDHMCYVRVYFGYFFYIVGMWLVAVLTVSKFLILKYPIRCGTWTKKMAHKTCSLTIIPSITLPVMFLVLDRDDIAFDYRVYACDYKFTAEVWKKPMQILNVLLIVLPNVLIITTAVPTLKYLADARISARRVRGNVPWQGTLTVSLTAVVYCVSTLPTFISRIGINSHNHQLFRIAKFLLLINTMANFYIYTLTIKSFRRFLLSKIICHVPVYSNRKISPSESTSTSNIAANTSNRFTHV